MPVGSRTQLSAETHARREASLRGDGSLVSYCAPRGHRDSCSREMSLNDLHFINFYFKGKWIREAARDRGRKKETQ